MKTLQDRSESSKTLDDMFQAMKEVYTNPPTFCEDRQKMSEEIDWIDWEIAKLRNRKKVILDHLKKSTNDETKHQPRSTLAP